MTNDELNKESQIKLIEENNHKNEVEFLKTRLIVVSIGVGTKVLNKNIIENEKKLKNNIKKVSIPNFISFPISIYLNY